MRRMAMLWLIVLLLAGSVLANPVPIPLKPLSDGSVQAQLDHGPDYTFLSTDIMLEGRFTARQVPTFVEEGQVYIPVGVVAREWGLRVEYDPFLEEVALLLPEGGEIRFAFGGPGEARYVGGLFLVPLQKVAWNLGLDFSFQREAGLISLVQSGEHPGFLKDLRYRVEPERVSLTFELTESRIAKVARPHPRRIEIELADIFVGEFARSIRIAEDVVLRQITLSPQPNRSAKILLELGWDLPERLIQVEQKGTGLTITFQSPFENHFSVAVDRSIRYEQMVYRLSDGPARVHVLRIDPTDPWIEVRPELANGVVQGRETVLSMVSRTGAVGGINGSYFMSNGDPLGFVMIDGQIVSDPLYNRTALGIGPGGRLVMENINMVSHVSIEGRLYSVRGFNRTPTANDLVVYTPHYGKETPTSGFVDLVVEDGVITGVYNGTAPIPANGWVVSATGSFSETLTGEVGEKANLSTQLIPDWQAAGILHAIAGGPRLVQRGQVYVTSDRERFRADIAVGRAPRSALAITERGELLLVSVEGRGSESLGMSLEELAQFLVLLGAREAMNLDGGGSSSLVVRRNQMNRPSDGSPRPVADGLLVYLRRP